MEDRRKRGVLGRGLSALLGDEGDVAFASGDAGVDSRAPTLVPVEYLQSGRFQPRTQFDQEALNDLADSIREKGIIQPILVRVLPEDSSRYEIIAGERRWRAAQIAQLHTVPVLVRDFSDRDAAEVALVENLQRRDLSPLEEAEGYRRLQDEFQHTQDDLSKAVGKSRSHVANMIRLLGLPDTVKDMMRTGSLTAGHARALLNASEPEILAEQVVKKGLNVRQTEKLATEKGGVKSRKDVRPSVRSSESSHKDTDTLALERDLARVLGLKVSIDFEGRGGRVVIHYATLEQLDDILYRLNNPTDNAADSRRVDPLESDDDQADQAFAAVFAAKVMPEGEGAVSDLDPDFDLDPDAGVFGELDSEESSLFDPVRLSEESGKEESLEEQDAVGEEMLALTVEALMEDYDREIAESRSESDAEERDAQDEELAEELGEESAEAPVERLDSPEEHSPL